MRPRWSSAYASQGRSISSGPEDAPPLALRKSAAITRYSSLNLHSAHCRKGLCGHDRQNLPPGYARLIDGYLRQLCYRSIVDTLKAMMKTGHTGCNTAYHHSTGGGPAAARSFHNAILTPGTRLSSVCSGQHRLRKKLRRLWEPNQLQDVRLHRIQAGEAGLDHPSLGIFDLYQTIVCEDLEEARHGRVQGIPPFGHQPCDRLLEFRQRPAHRP